MGIAMIFYTEMIFMEEKLNGFILVTTVTNEW